MALSDKLNQISKETTTNSIGMSTSEEINYRVRLAEIERQNELIAQRIDQLATNIEQNNKEMNLRIARVLEMSEKNSKNLDAKIGRLQETQEVLKGSLNNTLQHYFTQMHSLIGQQFNKKTDKIVADFSNNVNSIKEKANEVQEMRIKTRKIEEISVSIVQVLLYALISVISVTGLKWGIWNVLGLSKLYENVSEAFEWGWLVMAIILGVIVLVAFILAFNFVKNKAKTYRF